MINDIAIYQLPLRVAKNLGIRPFVSLEEMLEMDGFCYYEKVYEGEFVSDSNSVAEMLEEIFEEFNIHHPKNYRARSLSVSDIVELNEEFYYCDDFGWQKLGLEGIALKR